MSSSHNHFSLPDKCAELLCVFILVRSVIITKNISLFDLDYQGTELTDN
jgi:hypothetical protein